MRNGRITLVAVHRARWFPVAAALVGLDRSVIEEGGAVVVGSSRLSIARWDSGGPPE
jgi:hypothetical protein